MCNSAVKTILVQLEKASKNNPYVANIGVIPPDYCANFKSFENFLRLSFGSKIKEHEKYFVELHVVTDYAFNTNYCMKTEIIRGGEIASRVFYTLPEGCPCFAIRTVSLSSPSETPDVWVYC